MVICASRFHVRTTRRSSVYYLLAQSLVVIALCMIVSGCATHISPVTSFSPPPPIIYAPPRPPQPLVHIVKASWYGTELAGRPTTTGERYDPNRLTAASKTLPLGSIVKVENPRNGRSVTVRINDRGPFVRGRSLDLSRGAARKIGITHEGVARVKLTTLETPSH
jgi:rare lipoprotein A